MSLKNYVQTGILICHKKKKEMPYYCQRAETIFLFLVYGKAGTSRKNKVDQMGPTFGWQPRRTAEEADLETQQAETQKTHTKFISMRRCKLILNTMMLKLWSPSISDQRGYRDLWKTLGRERNLGGNQDASLENYLERGQKKYDWISEAQAMVHFNSCFGNWVCIFTLFQRETSPHI